MTVLAFTLFAFGLAMTARAELTIEITQGVDDPTPIAVVPFAWQGQWFRDLLLGNDHPAATVGHVEDILAFHGLQQG